MGDIEKFVEEITINRGNLKKIVFSVFDHILSKEEAKNMIMSYDQAVQENRIDVFENYQERYTKAFLELYSLFKKNILIYTVYDESEFPCSTKFQKVNIFNNGIDTYYRCENIDVFLEIINENIKEKQPFRNILFENHDVLLEFNFDFTFIISYKEEEYSFVDKLKEIFINNKLYLT